MLRVLLQCCLVIFLAHYVQCNDMKCIWKVMKKMMKGVDAPKPTAPPSRRPTTHPTPESCRVDLCHGIRCAEGLHCITKPKYKCHPRCVSNDRPIDIDREIPEVIGCRSCTVREINSCYDGHCGQFYECKLDKCTCESTCEPRGCPKCIVDPCHSSPCTNGDACVLKPCSCEHMCKAEKPCEGDPEYGDCDGTVLSWYYDKSSKTCKSFLYSGCGGNGNMYKNKHSCMQSCSPCYAPPTDTPCSSAAQFYYDYKLHQCKQVNPDGDCPSSKNLFNNQVLCENTCDHNVPMCDADPEYGDCSGSDVRVKMWYFEPSTRSCREFVYSGCGGNANKFATEESCMSSCLYQCYLPKEVGDCDGEYPRYFFNKVSSRCEKFMYGGCGANKNNFMNEDQCQEACGVCRTCSVAEVNSCHHGKCGNRKCYFNSCTCESTCDHSVCLCLRDPCETNPCSHGETCVQKGCCSHTCKPKKTCWGGKDEGDCDGTVLSWYYDESSKTCKSFLYSGCGGNGNVYKNKHSCLYECRKECYSPPDDGHCTTNMPGYYFDAREHRCKKMMFSVCGGNSNFYTNLEHCRETCDALKPTCDGKPVYGDCEMHIKMWYFDSSKRSCREFTYSGCGGHGNQYLTKESCLSSCRRECYAPSDAGPCKKYFPRYFYNMHSRRCEMFTYGGCHGNDNNYEDLATCHLQCGTEECPKTCLVNPCHVMRCGAGTECVNEPDCPCKAQCLPQESNGRRRGLSEFSEKCQRCTKDQSEACHAIDCFPGSHCSFNSCTCQSNCVEEDDFCNRNCAPDFNPCSVMLCVKDTVCMKDPKCHCRGMCVPQGEHIDETCVGGPVPGECKAYFPSWYYDTSSGTCKEFIYGGCGGNGNKYETEKDCMKKCSTSICYLPPFQGPCRGAFLRYFFNKKTQICDKFTYGGCQANGNNFETREDCQRSCGEHETCVGGPVPGNCEAYFPSWYYDTSSGTCKEFIYGGCGGNGNKYETEKDCMKKCSTSICYLPPFQGPCRGAFLRYFFNKKTQICDEFTYGGCQANGNNFETREDCQRSCEECPQCSDDPCDLMRCGENTECVHEPNCPCKAQCLSRACPFCSPDPCERVDCGPEKCRVATCSCDPECECRRDCISSPCLTSMCNTNEKCTVDPKCGCRSLCVDESECMRCHVDPCSTVRCGYDTQCQVDCHCQPYCRHCIHCFVNPCEVHQCQPGTACVSNDCFCTHECLPTPD